MADHDARQTNPDPATGLPGAPAPQAALLDLLGLFNAGRHGEMERAAAALAQRHPDDGQVWKAWGVALLVQRKDATAALGRAMALLPDDAEVPSNLGGVLVARGELGEAEACYRRALRLRPDFASVHSNLADVLARQQRWVEAETCCREALRLQPGLAEAIASYRAAARASPALAEAHAALGEALRAAGALDEACASLQRAADMRPRHAADQDRLGLALHAAGRHEAARERFEAALRLAPEAGAPHFHLGNLLMDRGDPAGAALNFRAAIERGVATAPVHANLGVALLALQQVGAAVDALHEAAALAPGDAVVLANLGPALAALGRHAQAQAVLEQAVARQPDLVLARTNLAHQLKTVGEPAAALAQLVHAAALEPEAMSHCSEILFTEQYLPQSPSRDAQMPPAARRFAALATQQARPFVRWTGSADPDRPLRVGWLSADLRAHPVGFTLEAVLAALRARSDTRIESWAYANQRDEDAVTARLRRSFVRWTPCAESDDTALARRIHDDGIDVLVDLSGHTRGHRLGVLAWRPAPVQASWLGYCGTTGLQTVDALLVDRVIAPETVAADAFAERLLHLPASFLCLAPPAEAPAPGPLPARARGRVRFACFNHPAKLGDAALACWSRILAARPDSELALQADAWRDDEIAGRLRARFACHGIDPARLLLQPPLPRAAYLASYHDIDIGLDPFPYPGGATTLDALWMGVPVLTQPGDSLLSRQGESILRHAGLDDWVARDDDDYVARALRFASDLDALEECRAGLRGRVRASGLCDAPRFAVDLEAALRSLWVRHCARGGA
jgi:protein O-GlcNAc transferase